MIEKIFAKLKQGYSHLGLGDAILRSHAEGLNALGYVTDENIDAVVASQKGFLEALQKANDTRVADAIKKTKKEAEEEAAKKAAEAKKKAEEEAAKKAEAAKLAAQEAQKRAEDEAAKKRQEELNKSNEIPQYLKDLLAQQEQKAKAQQEAFEAKIAELVNSSAESKAVYDEAIKKLTKANETANKQLAQMVSEAEAAKAAKARQERAGMILSKAKELGIPQKRIDEGFAIADDMTEDAISTYLSKVAVNAKASQLPTAQNYAMGGGGTTQEEIDQLASLIVQ